MDSKAFVLKIDMNAFVYKIYTVSKAYGEMFTFFLIICISIYKDIIVLQNAGLPLGMLLVGSSEFQIIIHGNRTPLPDILSSQR